MVWRGKGYWVIISFFIGYLIGTFLANQLHIIPERFTYFGVLMAIAIVNLITAVIFTKNETDWTKAEYKQILIHERQGGFPNIRDGFVFRLRNSRYSNFFFVRNRHWSYFFFGAAIATGIAEYTIR